MFRKISLTLCRLATPHKQGGQVSILFALLMPIFILFLGVALDLGWYYLNVSRLQNAADAAAVAGAQAIVDSENFSDYKNIALIGKYPAKVSNQYRANSVYESTTIENGKLIAEEYAGKNLSGNENTLVNSWTNNEVQTEASTLYTANDKLYFVVKLKDTIQHFFLPGWFDDMDAPVTAVAIMSKTAIDPAGETLNNDNSIMPNFPLSASTQSDSDLPTMPSVPTDPRVISQKFQYALEDDRNKNVIVGNWEVQNAYKNDNTGFQAHFGYKVYDKAWNHLQDLKNHYYVGDLYRKQTVNILDDVTTDGQVTANGIKTYASKTFGGNGSSVRQTPAAKNSNKSSTAYNPDGYPYLGERVDSLNIDFKPEVTLSGDWLEQDWDLTIEKNFPANDKYLYKDWAGTVLADNVKRLRIHSSLNFNGTYKERNVEFREKDEDGITPLKNNGKIVPDVLWVRIESEPILLHPDLISSETKENYNGKGIINSGNGVTGLNSVNQIIININAENTAEDDRPVVIFYDGPETNNIYCDEESEKQHVRDSLPVILNLNKPFRGVLYAPDSPIVIIGDAKDNFQGFVVAKKYMRLKDERDFVVGDPPAESTILTALSIYGLRTYYAKEDTAKKTPYYKVTDENGIEMFVDSRGDIQFAEFTNGSPTRYGTYNTFGRTKLTTHDYEIEQHSMDNMLLSGK